MYLQRRGNKYNNVSQTYNGYTYHSRKEAAYAQELDLLLKAKPPHKIKSWERQVKISFDVDEQGKLIARLPNIQSVAGKFFHICNYYIDFIITHMDGSLELVEIKGMETDVWKLKRTLVEATLLRSHSREIKYTVIK